MNELFSGNLAIREQARTLFSFILSAGPVTRPVILDHLALPPTTLNRALERLKADGLILESGQAESTGGRPASLFSVRADARLILGITVSDQQMSMALLDLTQSPVAHDVISLGGDPGSDEWSGALEKAVIAWVKTVPNVRPRLCCVGLALSNDQLSQNTANSLKKRLARQLACPVFVEETLSLANVFFRADPKSTQSFALLSVGDHISLYWTDEARVDQEKPDPKTISGFLMTDPLKLEPFERVIIEDLVTTEAIARRFSTMRDSKNLRIDDFLDAFQQGKKKAMRLAEATADTLALLLVNIACVTGVTAFMPTGELFDCWPELIDLIEEKIPAQASLSGVTIQLSKPEHAIQDGAAGTAAKALERILRRSAQLKEPVDPDLHS